METDKIKREYIKEETRSSVRVSVIVPVYNAEKYIGRTLKAICGQTYDNLEILIVNDGSADGTADICRSFSESDRRIIYTEQKNMGVGAARNTGIHMASAEYIMFVDADDLIDEDFIEQMMKPLFDASVDLSVCDIDNIDSITGKHNLSEIRLPIGISETRTDKNAISKIRTFCWGKIYKKSLWTENHIYFPEGELYQTMPGFEDVCCLPLIAAHAKRIAHVGDVSYHYYRGHEDGLMYGARFDYFLNSQIETMRRFQSAGLEQEYHESLRKFMLGQLVSANRWSVTKEEVKRLWSFIDTYFSELSALCEYKIYAPDGIAYDVLKHVFFDRTCFIKERDSSDETEKILVFDVSADACGDAMNYENFCYDEADKIIDRLPEIMRDFKINRMR